MNLRKHCFAIFAIFLASCEPNEEHKMDRNGEQTSPGEFAADEFDASSGMAPKYLNLDPQDQTNEDTPERDSGIPFEDNPNPARSGGIVAKKRTISTGDLFLQAVAKNGHSVPLLAHDYFKEIDLMSILAKAKQMATRRQDAPVVDATHAYARVLDLDVSMIGEIVLKGVYDHGDFFWCSMRTKKECRRVPTGSFLSERPMDMFLNTTVFVDLAKLRDSNRFRNLLSNGKTKSNEEYQIMWTDNIICPCHILRKRERRRSHLGSG